MSPRTGSLPAWQNGLTGPLPEAIDSVARTRVRKNGADVRERRGLDFIEGDNITLTVADNPAGEKVDVRIAVSGLDSGDLSDFTEAAQDAVGAALTDTATIDFTYTDGSDQITADVKSSSIGTSHLADDAVTAAKLDSTMVPHAEVYRSGSTFARVNSTSYQDMTVGGAAQTKQITKLVVEGSVNGITPATGGGGNAVYSFGVNDGSTDHDVGSVFAHDNSFESQVCPGFAEIAGLSAGTVTLTLRHKLSATGNGFGPTAGSVTLKITETF